MATTQETYIAQFVDAATGEIVERPFTDQEIVEHQNIGEQIRAEQETKATARASALAKLAELGFTAEEVAAL